METNHNFNQKAPSGQPLLPTGIYLVPYLQPRFAQVSQTSVSHRGMLHPTLAKESL